MSRIGIIVVVRSKVKNQFGEEVVDANGNRNRRASREASQLRSRNPSSFHHSHLLTGKDIDSTMLCNVTCGRSRSSIRVTTSASGCSGSLARPNAVVQNKRRKNTVARVTAAAGRIRLCSPGRKAFQHLKKSKVAPRADLLFPAPAWSFSSPRLRTYQSPRVAEALLPALSGRCPVFLLGAPNQSSALHPPRQLASLVHLDTLPTIRTEMLHPTSETLPDEIWRIILELFYDVSSPKYLCALMLVCKSWKVRRSIRMALLVQRLTVF
jgi:hypothetical protein